MDDVLRMHPLDLRKAHHTASGSLSESLDGVRPEYPAVEGITVEPFHQDPESGSVPLEDLYRSTPTVAERKHAA